MDWWAKIHLYHEIPKIHQCWCPKDWENGNNEFYLYLPKMTWNPFQKFKLHFDELNLTRKENVLRNPKPTRKKKFKEHLKNLFWTLQKQWMIFYQIIHRPRKAISKDKTLLLPNVATIGNKTSE